MFETLTDRFAEVALDGLEPLLGAALLDVGAGTGGAAIAAAGRGARVTAIDAAAGMVARIRQRSPDIDARQQDGMALALPAMAFDRALSCFGVVLFPEPARGMAELFRVLRPGGRVAIVTWTEPHRYDLARRLREAAGSDMPAAQLPAQLRFIDPTVLHSLVADSGFSDIRIERVEASLTAPSARTLASSLAFAPGMAAMLNGLGAARAAIIDRFTTTLEADQGTGPVALPAVAHIAIATRP